MLHFHKPVLELLEQMDDGMRWHLLQCKSCSTVEKGAIVNEPFYEKMSFAFVTTMKTLHSFSLFDVSIQFTSQLCVATMTPHTHMNMMIIVLLHLVQILLQSSDQCSQSFGQAEVGHRLISEEFTFHIAAKTIIPKGWNGEIVGEAVYCLGSCCSAQIVP